ncbi:Vitamin B12 import ATP-binding protein BtuD [Austwickia sp. TVS 96-490-7B]|uniref:ABC transporter ATP-binding protein n=1 Tax=Austwickia sp. TVS 96-490-7B TaxID=2830843 RepID=UPI001C5A3CD3|nr:ATP-binding cassette domain-containing protein [Austwickia sp. TVS 96-490-7B]MBW3086408.1 Vitamin B12 import ATP-binding protein BtuD [Austwickia sp. TVS 96-490-7B]
MADRAGGASPWAIDTQGLRKTFWQRRGRVVAVEGLDLQVPLGGVHAFLGPNGSGKTTTLRMLLGLARPDAGVMSIFGHSIPRNLPLVMGRIGAIVERPRMFPTFTGQRNLELLADAAGVSRSRVGTVVEQVGLTEQAKDAVKSYSLGMTQRLAVAATLLKDPELVIFDEPTNGLDPAGIKEIRRTMRDLGDQGRTVLVSSHLLGEVQQVADTVSIVGRGRILGQGTVGEILAGVTVDRVRVVTADLVAARRVLEHAGYVVATEADALMVESATDPARITRILAGQHLYVQELVPIRADLESAFLHITSTDAVQGPPGTPASTEGWFSRSRRDNVDPERQS